MDNKIKHLQKILLSITMDIVELCDKHNIQYSLCGGSLLGAVRHEGFIPWDDDMDLCMDRENYEKFLHICKIELNREKYFLQTEETEKDYGFAFAKIQLVGTEIIEDFSKDVPIHHGIFVDVFPYDYVPQNQVSQKIFLAINHFYKNLEWVKCGYGSEKQKQKLIYKFLKFISAFIKLNKLKDKRRKHITKYKDKPSALLFNSDYPQTLLSIEFFNQYEKILFEEKCYMDLKIQAIIYLWYMAVIIWNFLQLKNVYNIHNTKLILENTIVNVK